MTTSDLIRKPPQQLYVWIWLPDAVEPVVCGRLDAGSPTTFTYARSYRSRADAVAVFAPELPLDGAPPLTPLDGDGLPLCIEDALSDAWGRRLVDYGLGVFGDLPALTYLAASGSDRIGALDFQRSNTDYEARGVDTPTLDELADAAIHLEEGRALNAQLAAALLHGTSIGGARPKALLRDGGRSLIAKFSSTTDTYPIVQGEYVAMTLARRCGLNVAPVSLAKAHHRYALLVERFDRPGAGRRLRVVSALTVLGLNAFPSGRYATYTALADEIRRSFAQPLETLRELFGRIAFNIVCGNTDDHGRNHAALVDEAGLRLSPAYDICPQARSGGEAYQAMAYGRHGERVSKLASLVACADAYHLDHATASDIVEAQIQTVSEAWGDVCDQAELTAMQRSTFWGGQFLNPFVMQD
jgi:serine/threonine-protein kinase HipA